MKKALIVIDMLNDFCDKKSALFVPDNLKILPFIKKEIESARESGIPIIYLCDSHDEDDEEFKLWPRHCVKGEYGAEIVNELKPKESDIIVEKKTYSGFYKTKLESILKELGIDTLVLTGCVTNICILFTAFDAVKRGYKVIVKKDCVAGLDEKDSEFALKLMKNVLGVKIE
jgi:nicotinamidase-related amidase